MFTLRCQCLVGAGIGGLLDLLLGVGHVILGKDEALGGKSDGRDDGGLAVNHQRVAIELVGFGLIDGKNVLPPRLADAEREEDDLLGVIDDLGSRLLDDWELLLDSGEGLVANSVHPLDVWGDILIRLAEEGEDVVGEALISSVANVKRLLPKGSRLVGSHSILDGGECKKMLYGRQLRLADCKGVRL